MATLGGTNEAGAIGIKNIILSPEVGLRLISPCLVAFTSSSSSFTFNLF